MRSKNAGIDVTLHADSIFDIIFARGRVEMGHLETRFFTKAFLKGIRVYCGGLKVVVGEASGFASILVLLNTNSKEQFFLPIDL